MPSVIRFLQSWAPALATLHTLDLIRDHVTVRRAVPDREKLVAPVIAFDRLPGNQGWWGADAVVCALGTTIKTAGSRAAFWKVDHDYTLDAACLARAAGARAFVLNCAMGADPASQFFYNRVKGDTERDLATLGCPSLTLVRPSLIGRRWEQPRGPHDLSPLAERSLGNPAPWFGFAMRLRDAAVRPFGVRTSGQILDHLRSRDADRIDFFPVLSRSEREILFGEDDRHLDFRLSLLMTARPDGGEDLTATTVVRCRNLLGRGYLAAIMAGHVLVVRSALRQASRA